jgi:hypothetical protein
MARKVSRRLRLAGVLSVGTGLLLGAAPAHADDYTDLLSLLRAKGSLTQGEYAGLLSKHVGNSARGTEARRGGRSTEARRGRGTGSLATDDAVAQARAAAAAASASAAAAQEAAQSAKVELASPSLVRTSPYVAGKGVDIRIGNIDLNFSGFVNGFYTFSSAAHSANTVAGGLADNSGFDSSSIRNGLLPAGLIFKASTTQNGIDLAAEFGVYPGINSSNQGTPFNANGGGSPVGLGTAGVDFRQVFVTAGTAAFGTVKVGRDIGIFGSDAILSDATLLSVGATGGNSAPGNTSLGRIGTGYIYADFMPQITYSSPIVAGFQATVGAFQPLDEVNFAGGGLSATSAAHDTPMFQGKLTYDYKAGITAARVWLGGLIQPQQGFAAATAVSLNQTSAHAIGDKTTGAGEIGAKIDSGPFGGVVYYYRARGVGTTGLMFDGVSAGGALRDSEGFYAQGSFKPAPKLKLVASYGESSLFQATGEVDPLLVRRNAATIGAGYYSLTDWMTLVGEYAHVQAHNNAGAGIDQNVFTAGTILFF